MNNFEQFNLYSFDTLNCVLIHFQTIETRTELTVQWICTFFFRLEISLEDKIRLYVQTDISPQAFCALFEIFGAFEFIFMVEMWQIVHC